MLFKLLNRKKYKYNLLNPCLNAFRATTSLTYSPKIFTFSFVFSLYLKHIFFLDFFDLQINYKINNKFCWSRRGEGPV